MNANASRPGYPGRQSRTCGRRSGPIADELIETLVRGAAIAVFVHVRSVRGPRPATVYANAEPERVPSLPRSHDEVHIARVKAARDPPPGPGPAPRTRPSESTRCSATSGWNTGWRQSGRPGSGPVQRRGATTTRRCHRHGGQSREIPSVVQSAASSMPRPSTGTNGWYTPATLSAMSARIRCFETLVLAFAEVTMTPASLRIEHVERGPVPIAEGVPDVLVVVGWPPDERPSAGRGPGARSQRSFRFRTPVCARRSPSVLACTSRATRGHVRRRAQPVDAREGAELNEHDSPDQLPFRR